MKWEGTYIVKLKRKVLRVFRDKKKKKQKTKKQERMKKKRK